MEAGIAVRFGRGYAHTTTQYACRLEDQALRSRDRICAVARRLIDEHAAAPE